MKYGLSLALGLALAGAPALSQPTDLNTVRIISGLTRPVLVTHAPGDPTRLFIVEQSVGTTGQVRIFDLASGTLRATPFLQVPGVTTDGEQGLLGLAFHPQYQSNGFFYVNYTTTGGGAAGRTVVARYTVSGDPNVANAGSAQTVIRINQPYSNHNGGWIGFGPDGYLYVAMGDGGSGDDPQNHAQTISNDLLGKMLRLDVNGDDFPADTLRNYHVPPTNPFVGVAGDDEIWAYGLRNPWRDSFDRLTGDLWIGDVGQGAWEEIDFQPGGSLGGENYGWRCMEGSVCRALTGCDCLNPPNYTAPVHAYSHASGCSVTGGYVYRGCAIPDLHGTYFFADFCTATIWSFRYEGKTMAEFQDRTAQLAPGGGQGIGQISSFGEDFYGELYIVDYGDGEVYKVVPAGGATPDCNSNGVADPCDIAGGTSLDTDGDGVPDECEGGCPADYNGDGFVDGIDYDQFNNDFEAGNGRADINGDGFVDGIDSDLFNNSFEGGC